MSVIERFSIMPSWKDDEQPETIGLKMRTGDPGVVGKRSPAVALLIWAVLRIQCQAAAVRMFLCFFRLSFLAFEIGERHVQ
jgi:hypothetical protein